MTARMCRVTVFAVFMKDCWFPVFTFFYISVTETGKEMEPRWNWGRYACGPWKKRPFTCKTSYAQRYGRHEAENVAGGGRYVCLWISCLISILRWLYHYTWNLCKQNQVEVEHLFLFLKFLKRTFGFEISEKKIWRAFSFEISWSSWE